MILLIWCSDTTAIPTWTFYSFLACELQPDWSSRTTTGSSWWQWKTTACLSKLKAMDYPGKIKHKLFRLTLPADFFKFTVKVECLEDAEEFAIFLQNLENRKGWFFEGFYMHQQPFIKEICKLFIHYLFLKCYWYIWDFIYWYWHSLIWDGIQ